MASLLRRLCLRIHYVELASHAKQGGAFVQSKHLHNPASASKDGRKTKMSSWFIHQYGDNSELELSPSRIPTIQNPKDILIQVHAASVNPIDVKMRNGYGNVMINLLRKNQGIVSEFPLILGRDFSGTVVETGKAVRNFRPGDEVWGALNAYRPGSHAQYTVTSEQEVSLKPQSLSHVEAAAMPYVAVTAWRALYSVGELREKSTRDKKILILGGSGGIGTFSIQLLKAWGADIATTCSTDAVERVYGLGADVVVDYKTQDITSELAKLKPFIFLLDAVGTYSTDFCLGLLKPWSNATYVSIVSPILKNADQSGLVLGSLQTVKNLGPKVLKGLTSGKNYRVAVFYPDGKALRKIARMVDNGQIKPIIDHVFTFEDLPAAYAKVEAGHSRGKCVVNFLGDK